MHSILQRWLVPALFAGLLLAGSSLAQPPGPKGEPLATISVNDIVERIMAFDKNKDGKVTKDELPERMHHLIGLGDTNKDGALDKDEVQKLVTRPPAGPGGFGGGAVQLGVGPSPGPGVPGGFGVGGPVRIGAGPGPGVRGGFGVGGQTRLGPDAAEGVVEDLKLPAKKKEQAMAAVKAHRENVRKLMDQARAELLEKMKQILNEEEFKDFQAALDRPRTQTFLSVGPLPGPEGERKLDPPQK